MLELSLGNVWAWALQVAALAGAGVILPSILRMTSPRVRLLHFRALLLVCLALPLLQPWVPRPVADVSAAAVAPADLPDGIDTLGPAGPAGQSGQPAESSGSGFLSTVRWPLQTVVVGVYLLGVSARFFWLGLGLISLARLRRSAVPLDPRPEAVDAAALLVGADAGFLVSAKVVRPVTFGVRWPVVLVPPGFLSFDAGQQTAVAAHELLHVSRRDWVRTIGDELLLSVLWFHPVLWWLVEQIRLSTEQLVDREVVRLVGARKPYLEALLKLAAAGPTPMLQPASLFLKHGHLAQRVALLVREVSMSRVRLVSSFVLVLAVLAAGGWAVVQAFPLTAAFELAVLPSVPVAVGFAQAPPPPPPPPPPPAPPQTKPTVGASVPAPGAIPTIDGSLASYVAVAKKYEDAGDLTNAEKTYLELMKAQAKDPKAFLIAAGFYNRRGEFDKTIAALSQRAQLEPTNPEGPYTLATYYWDKAYRDKTLDEVQKREFIGKGLEQADRAVQMKPDYMEALTYKNLLLRLQATIETDPAVQKDLIAEADKLRDQAIKIRDAQNKWDAVPANAVRIGGGIQPPTKTKNVSPVYPPDALAARVAGVVIIEAVIGEDGKVRAARVRRSIPLLDPAALEAVRQWEFTPTLLNGAPVPVVMTATVNFVPKEASGVAGGVVGGVAGAFDAPPPPPPPPPPPAGDKTFGDPMAIRVGGGIAPPRKVVHVDPVYPAEAKDARAQGVVILEVLIGVDGKVEQTKVLRSIPLFDQAAVDAVRQWEFTPTLLNGEPKKVIMTVTVNFTLQ
jgi:TonB family protein